MRTIGFIISDKENERRRAIDISDLEKVRNKDRLYFQKGYGEELGFSDEELVEIGCHVADKEEVMECDIICEPKIGDSEELNRMKNKIVLGWIHATQNYDIAQACIDNELTVYAWEKMFDESGRHIFCVNNQIAGKAAVLHAMLECGRTFNGLKVAVLGNGNTSKGAVDTLKRIGADVTIYDYDEEKTFVAEKNLYDVIVNCILWDTSRKDHIIYKNDLKDLKKNCVIIDVSCDRNGGIETSIPTTIDNPTYYVDGVMHYVVDHTPSLLYKEATKSISSEVVNFLDNLIEEEENKILENALIIKDGKVIDEEINKFQGR